MAFLNNLFFSQTDLDHNFVVDFVDESLQNLDDGELFLEHSTFESLFFSDNVLKNASYNTNHGFGLRGIKDELTSYAHSSEISMAALKRAQETVCSITSDKQAKHYDIGAFSSNDKLYTEQNPIHDVSFDEKTSLLQEIDAYVRAKDPRVKQVSVALSGSWQAVQIVKRMSHTTGDIRPLVRLNVSVTVEENGRMETGSYGAGGRVPYAQYFAKEQWQHHADEALRQALVSLKALPAPAGNMPVILGSGWPGVLLHEAIGHGLEGDFNRKGTSAFSNLIGSKVASDEITIVDDGTLKDLRGSITIDDEGTPSGCTTLIENGVLIAYMTDRMNANLLGTKPTGNGRRESYAHQPLPRMTNTYMLSGPHTAEDIISSVENGIYAVSFGGGQVDITSGKFVFSASEAYMVENGKITHPIKGATLIGNGPDVLTKVSKVANDMKLDDGIGTCGKAGQSVPVGVGQPTLLVDDLTVGGTEV
ncbi:MAG: metalloprotease TldD [Rickettsiales bacterium]|nr:metalloprotease TldD [Rickettsiales bacterium]